MVHIIQPNPDAQRRLPVTGDELVEEGLPLLKKIELVQWNARHALAQQHAIIPGIPVGVSNVRPPVIQQEQLGVGDAAKMDLRVISA